MRRTPPHIGTVELRYRTKPNYIGLTARLVGVLVWCVSWTSWAKRFNTNYHTLINGVLYSPEGKEPSMAIIVHEKLHVVQEREHALYKLRYLVSRAFRLRMEAEAYGLTVALGLTTFDRAYRALTGGMYWVNNSAAYRELASAADEYAGRVKGE